jgi:hypothetical protein
MRNNKLPMMVLAAGFAVLGVLPAVASTGVATLSSFEGTVLVNQGEEFFPAQDSMALAPGDRILALENGRATIAFTAGCVVPVEPGQLVTVPIQTPCTGEGLVQADALTAPLGGAEPADPPWINYALGFGTAGVTTGILLLWDDDDKDRDEATVSP